MLRITCATRRHENKLTLVVIKPFWSARQHAPARSFAPPTHTWLRTRRDLEFVNLSQTCNYRGNRIKSKRCQTHHTIRRKLENYTKIHWTTWCTLRYFDSNSVRWLVRRPHRTDARLALFQFWIDLHAVCAWRRAETHCCVSHRHISHRLLCSSRTLLDYSFRIFGSCVLFVETPSPPGCSTSNSRLISILIRSLCFCFVYLRFSHQSFHRLNRRFSCILINWIYYFPMTMHQERIGSYNLCPISQFMISFFRGTKARIFFPCSYISSEWEFSVLISKIETHSLIIISFFFFFYVRLLFSGAAKWTFIIKFICKQHAIFTCHGPMPSPRSDLSAVVHSQNNNNYYNFQPASNFTCGRYIVLYYQLHFHRDQYSFLASFFLPATLCTPIETTDDGHISKIGRPPITDQYPPPYSVHGMLSKWKFGAHKQTRNGKIFAFAWHVVFGPILVNLLICIFIYIFFGGREQNMFPECILN